MQISMRSVQLTGFDRWVNAKTFFWCMCRMDGIHYSCVRFDGTEVQSRAVFPVSRVAHPPAWELPDADWAPADKKLQPLLRGLNDHPFTKQHVAQDDFGGSLVSANDSDPPILGKVGRKPKRLFPPISSATSACYRAV